MTLLRQTSRVVVTLADGPSTDAELRSIDPSLPTDPESGVWGDELDGWRRWIGRANTVTARTDRVDVDALLIRPDGCVAWALPTGPDLDATSLVRALGTWFGQRAWASL